MTFIVEDGTGVSGANAYTTVAAYKAYHTDRGIASVIESDASDPEITQAIVRATDFIEQRWGLRFRGQRQFINISAARATLTLTALPLTAEIVTIGSTAFTFGAGNVEIAASIAATIDNLVVAVNTHPDVVAQAGVADTMIVTAKSAGTPGNAIVTTETLTNGSWSSPTLLGGADVAVPQPLSFPRMHLVDREGLVVSGIPARLKHATAEYAIRAVATVLMPDPTVDDSGRIVLDKSSSVGPIKERTRFEEGGALSQLLRPYPAADRLLSDYLTPAGGAIR